MGHEVMKGEDGCVEVLFYDFYELDQDKIILQNDKELLCDFCGRDAEETTFDKKAHVIPAALGNRILFNKLECDSCNENNGSYENELVNLLALERVILGGRKRSGYPKFKPYDTGSSSIKRLGEKEPLRLEIDEKEDNIDIKRLDKNKLCLSIKGSPSYKPLSVCKSLVHMAWPLLQEGEKKELDHYREWLEGKESVSKAYLDQEMLNGNGIRRVSLEIWRLNGDHIRVRFVYGRKILTTVLLKETCVEEPDILQYSMQEKLIPDDRNIFRITACDDSTLKVDNNEFVISHEKID